MKVLHISAVTLAVRQMDRSVDFYQKVGLELAYGGKQASFTSFRAGAGFINLILSSSPFSGSWGRLILRVDDADSTHDALRQQGLNPEQPRNGEWGERYFHLKDPDGHELSFAQILR